MNKKIIVIVPCLGMYDFATNFFQGVTMSNLLFTLILLPFIAGVLCYFTGVLRPLIVFATTLLMVTASVFLVGQGVGTFYSPGPLLGMISWNTMIAFFDFLLLIAILYYGFKHNNLLIKIFTVFQMAGLVILELFWVDHNANVNAFYVDQISLILVLIISIIGGLICLFALSYMKEHEAHLKLKKSRQGSFFLYMILFLGAMNGLVLSNNLLWVYFFFEVTTFCSFKLIGHDQTKEAITNSVRALWMNSLGGVAFVLGLFGVYMATNTVDLQSILSAPASGALVLFSIGLLCFAGFTKAAQLPFQGWLLGAMVAPTPVSALLHSSTMVKAGVYLVLRLAPGMAGSFLSDAVAYCGAFTFIAAAALAIGQSNGKKILAYSTISNLGLIIACAGINTGLSLAAALFLILFHAISKSLLFLCVGTIEHGIGSRDIEDMRGLYRVMPRTAWVTIVGILTMILPPFGVLMAKWMAIESASSMLPVIVLLAIGSALSLLYWARWAGSLLDMPGGRVPEPETLPLLIRMPLLILVLSAVFLSAFAPVIYELSFVPLLEGQGILARRELLSAPIFNFPVYTLFLLLSAGVLIAFLALKRAEKIKPSPPYTGGLTAPEKLDGTFIGPMNVPVTPAAGQYYLKNIFGEEKITPVVNIAAVALLILMIGGAL